jgi:hypothetical protein
MLPGYSTHVSIEQHPRLIVETPTGFKRSRQMQTLRLAADRAISTKEDYLILRDPQVALSKGLPLFRKWASLPR